MTSYRTPCVWSHNTPKYKYPCVWVASAKRSVQESRLVWEEAYGPIPPGLCVCHHCDNTRCIRLDHFFLGTKGDNARDMVAKGRGFQQKKDRCPHGHPYDEENTIIVVPKATGMAARRCRACYNARRKERRERQRALGLRPK